mgnify:CR=1 FL=1
MDMIELNHMRLHLTITEDHMEDITIQFMDVEFKVIVNQ